MMWRVFGGLTAVLAGITARKVLVKGWKMVTGKEPPNNPEAPGTSMREAVGWALASGAAVGMVRMLASRKAAHYYKRSTGHLPRGMEEVG
jgi:hypothetical protein